MSNISEDRAQANHHFSLNTHVVTSNPGHADAGSRTKPPCCTV